MKRHGLIAGLLVAILAIAIPVMAQDKTTDSIPGQNVKKPVPFSGSVASSGLMVPLTVASGGLAGSLTKSVYDAQVSQMENEKTTQRLVLTNMGATVIFSFQQEGVNVNATSPSGNTFLMLALQAGCENSVDAILEEPDVDLSIQDLDGRTAFHYAVMSRNPKIMKKVFNSEKAYDPVTHLPIFLDKKDALGLTPLGYTKQMMLPEELTAIIEEAIVKNHPDRQQR